MWFTSSFHQQVGTGPGKWVFKLEQTSWSPAGHATPQSPGFYTQGSSFSYWGGLWFIKSVSKSGNADVDGAAALEIKIHFPRRKTLKEILPQGMAFHWLHCVAQTFGTRMSPRPSSPRSFLESQSHRLWHLSGSSLHLYLNKCFISCFALDFVASPHGLHPWGKQAML